MSSDPPGFVVLPGYAHRFARAVHAHDPELAGRLAACAGTNLVALGLVPATGEERRAARGGSVAWAEDVQLVIEAAAHAAGLSLEQAKAARPFPLGDIPLPCPGRMFPPAGERFPRSGTSFPSAAFVFPAVNSRLTRPAVGNRACDPARVTPVYSPEERGLPGTGPPAPRRLP